MNRYVLALLFFAAVLLGAGCAIVSQPEGGPRDETPPQLVAEDSSPNYTTNSYPTVLVLEFDEYVVLKNASSDIVITPTPEAGRPKFEQRGRRVTVDLSELSYRDSTTYQIQFGEAVQDFNEGNAAKDLRYVFSTGAYLDSLKIQGEVIDNVTDAPAIGALVALYRSLSDTVFTDSAPDYFAKTDSSGRFRLDFLAPGTYQLASFADDNANLRLNHGAEAMAFLDSTITLRYDRPDSFDVRLRLSAERPPLLAMKGEQPFPGLLRMTFNQPVVANLRPVEIPGDSLAVYREADSLFVVYAPAVDTLDELVVELEGETDTVSFRPARREAPPAVVLVGAPAEVPGLEAVGLRVNLPLLAVNPDSIEVVVDSLPYPVGAWTISDEDPRELRWVAPTDTVNSFSVSFLPGALTTMFDTPSTDTLLTTVAPQAASTFGEVELQFEGLDSAQHYVVELLNSANAPVRTFQLSPKQNKLTLSRVAGGEYSIRLVTDVDANQRYSPGDRRLRRQPEPVRTFSMEQVRPDWVVEQKVVVGN